MATKIIFTHDEKEYCLEYTRKTVKLMEDRGISPANILGAPMTTLPELFAGAFLANHKFTDRKIIDAIYNKMGDKKALVGTLTKMYNEPIEALTADVEEGNAIACTTTD